MRIALLLATLLTLGLAASAGATPFWIKPVRISVIAINCARDGDDAPSVTVSRHGSNIGLTEASLAFGVHRLDFDLEPGTWSVAIGTRTCGGADDVTVLPHTPRHLIAVLPSKATVVGPSCSVAGRLPLTGLSVRLISARGTDVPVVVDGYSYYSQTFARGKYTLEFGMMEGERLDLPLDYSDQQPGELCNKRIERDLTLDELRAAGP
jgi:hypothetical protein